MWLRNTGCRPFNLINKLILAVNCIRKGSGLSLLNNNNNNNNRFTSMNHLKYSPAFERNRDPIFNVLLNDVLNPLLEDTNDPTTASKYTVLEVGSGTGQHAIYFTSCLSSSSSSSSVLKDNTIVWLPSEPDDIQSIQDWIDVTDDKTSIQNLCPPIQIDASSDIWSVVDNELSFSKLTTLSGMTVPPIKVIVCINMIHIAPWEATLGLLAGAKRILPKGGILYFYGPFMRSNEHTAPSNEQFDTSLRSRNPLWGIRDLETIVDTAIPELRIKYIIQMPANNLSVIFEKL